MLLLMIDGLFGEKSDVYISSDDRNLSHVENCKLSSGIRATYKYCNFHYVLSKIIYITNMLLKTRITSYLNVAKILS